MSYENRNFIIFNPSEMDKINFSEIIETSPQTLRFSINGLKTFVKWEGASPAFVSTLTTKEGPYTYSQMETILISNEWVNPDLP
jgi:hypothetical protein